MVKKKKKKYTANELLGTVGTQTEYAVLTKDDLFLKKKKGLKWAKGGNKKCLATKGEQVARAGEWWY